MEDIAPAFPLPARGDMVLVLVPGTSKLLSARMEWCTVTVVRLGEHDFYPVTVRTPDGLLGSYQQGEIRGWRQQQPARRWWQRRRWRG